MDKSGGTEEQTVCEKGKMWEYELLESLIIVAGLGGVAERLADVTVGPLVCRVAVIRRVRDRVGALGLSRAVFGVVEVKAVTDVTEQTRRRLLLLL